MAIKIPTIGIMNCEGTNANEKITKWAEEQNNSGGDLNRLIEVGP